MGTRVGHIGTQEGHMGKYEKKDGSDKSDPYRKKLYGKYEVAAVAALHRNDRPVYPFSS